MVMASRRPGAPVAHLAIYVVALVVSRLTLPEGGGAVFFWPAAGVAALWMLSGRTRAQVVTNMALLLISTAVVDVAFGVGVVESVLFGLANLSVGITVRGCSSLLEHRSFWGPLPRRIATPRDLAGLGVASLAAGLASAVPGLLALSLGSGDLTWEGAIGWMVRNACSTFVVVAAVLALLTTLLRAHAKRGWTAILVPEERSYWVPELVFVGVASTLGAVVLFGSAEALPVAYLMMVASTWIGYRFSPAVASVYALVLSVLAVLWTESGSGPFGPIEDLTTRAIVVQVYVLVTTVVVLLLSLGGYERAALHARVIESEARASRRADLVDAVTTVMSEGLSVIDPEGTVLLCNPAAEQMAGLRVGAPRIEPPEAHGVFHVDGSYAATEDLPRARALRGETVAPMDVLRIDPKSGQQTILSISAAPLKVSNSEETASAVVVMRDVTKVRAQRRELENFAGVVAHDLKAPLTGVISWAEILQDQLDDAVIVDGQALHSSVRKIRTSADRMAQLISDLLTYTQAQNAELFLESVCLDDMVAQITHDLQDTFRLEVPVVESAPLGWVLADPTLVRQLLTNLIGNAVKYVAPGVVPRIVITAERTATMLEVSVSDNGIGIPDQDLGRVFDSFFRASSTQGYPGTGLGLAICAQSVERHGGRISARKGIGGQGTTMIFTLPLDPSPPETADAQFDQQPVSVTS
jgi:signal transduction histidine kinase